MDQQSHEMIAKLTAFFSGQPAVAMAFLFGSRATNRATGESDTDLAVYFQPAGKEIEWEAATIYPQEDELWSGLERLLRQNVDFVVLNRAPATIAFEVLRTGTPLLIRDRGLYLDFYLRVSSEGMDFAGFVRDWWEIRERSASLSEIDRQRLIRLATFLERELTDRAHFDGMTKERYQNDSDGRRNLERWAENLINASIDIAKIALASEKLPVPETYRETVVGLGRVPGLAPATAQQLANFTRIRNVLAHEYLEVRYSHLDPFLKIAPPLYAELLTYCKKIIGT